jgi:hypothetical protein
MAQFDPQTCRVYDAEDFLTICPVGLSKLAMGMYLNVVLDDPRWRKKWGTKRLKIVMVSPNTRYARAYVHKGHPYIEIGNSNRQRGMHIILHELAHLLTNSENNHDQRFCKALLYLVEKYNGTLYARKLRHRFRQTGALR